MLVGVTTRVTTRQLSTAQGCLLGLVLGDAVGAAGAAVPAAGTLLGTTAGQLACFTVDGIIRANVRGSHKGICHPPSVVWHAYTRWAAMQGIPGIKRWRDEDWPDGWLANVSVLAVRRGSAPATVAALQSQTMGTVEKPVGSSTGPHGLTRALPAGLVDWWAQKPGDFAAEVAATTHRGEAVTAAAIGATIVSNIVKGQGIAEAVERARRDCLGLVQHEGHELPLESALSAARSTPGRASVLADLAPDARAMSALAGAVYVALSFPEPEQARDGLLFAASVAGGAHVAAVTGALLGTAHGVDALPVDWVSRLELAWVADVLARDFLAEFVDHPSGSEFDPAPDPRWWNRYPGW
jgi:ADP-ribosylglycohydrolase